MNARNLIFLLLLSSAGLNASINVIARFEPSRIALGNTPKYIVEITDSGADAPSSSSEQIRSLPISPVAGISFRNARTSSSQETRLLNGRAEYKITQRIAVDVIPSRVGSFTIPAYALDYKGARVQVPASTLTVINRSESAQPTANELVFLALEAPDEIYVGQTVPVTLKLFVEEGLNLNGYNSFERNADGFTINGGPPEKSITSEEVANGRRYQVFNWPLKITPIRTGKQDLSFYFELSVIVPRQRSRRSSPFGNSILDDFFGRTERLNVYTKPTQIEVLPLPVEGQPKSFSGAIGQFSIGVSSDNKSTRVNEPIMLSLKLSGEGNFDRIQAPELPEAEGWRSYPPESDFEADSVNEFKGTKRFDYIFIPEKSGTLKLPEVSFSFFDPAVKEYIELTSPAIEIEVAPSNIPSIQTSAPLNSENKTPTEPSISLTKTLKPEEVLSTLDYRPKKGRTVFTNSIVTPLFYWLNGSLLVILSTAAIIVYQRRRLLKSPHYERVHDAQKKLKTALSKTASADATTFFSNAQKAIRLAATIRTKSNLQAAHLPTLEAHLKQAGVAETTIKQIQHLFEAAEAQQFSGHSLKVNLDESRKQLKAILKAL